MAQEKVGSEADWSYQKPQSQLDHLQSAKPHPSSEAIDAIKSKPLNWHGSNPVATDIFLIRVLFGTDDDDDVYALSPACSPTAPRKLGGSALAVTHSS